MHRKRYEISSTPEIFWLEMPICTNHISITKQAPVEIRIIRVGNQHSAESSNNRKGNTGNLGLVRPCDIQKSITVKLLSYLTSKERRPEFAVRGVLGSWSHARSRCILLLHAWIDNCSTVSTVFAQPALLHIRFRSLSFDSKLSLVSFWLFFVQCWKLTPNASKWIEVAPSLKADTSVVLAVPWLKVWEFGVESGSARYWTRMMHKALKQNGESLQFAPEKFRDSRKVWSRAMQTFETTRKCTLRVIICCSAPLWVGHMVPFCIEKFSKFEILDVYWKMMEAKTGYSFWLYIVHFRMTMVKNCFICWNQVFSPTR